MRIASLFPAATEWICALGAGENLVGRSQACTYPPEILDRPVLTRSVIGDVGGAGAIDDAVRAVASAGQPLFELDEALLRDLRPDVVVTQGQCGVCALPASVVHDALRDTEAQVVTWSPMTFKQVLSQALALGRTLGRLTQAMAWLGAAEQRLRLQQEALGVRKTLPAEARPTVACIEWTEPVMAAGHWTPDLVDLAGGRAELAEAGAPSPVTTWDALQKADPDVIAILPCGLTIDETRRDLPALVHRPGWSDLQAVRTGRVVLLDGAAYFNSPSPRLYRAAELLLLALHPEQAAAAGLRAEPWELAWYLG